jgi:hypothetical protein
MPYSTYVGGIKISSKTFRSKCSNRHLVDLAGQRAAEPARLTHTVAHKLGPKL